MKKKIKTFLQIKVAPFFMQLVIRLIYLTNKKVFHHPKIDTSKTYIFAFWHGDLLMQLFNYKILKPKGKVKVMISEHKDGEAIRKTIEYLGIGSVSGSSSKGGVKAFINGMKNLKKGVDIGITPDGPRGPIYSIADGIVTMSHKTKAKIITLSSKPSRYWQVKSWDKFIIPKPFGTIEFFVGEPFEVEGLQMEEAKEVILKKMMENQLEK